MSAIPRTSCSELPHLAEGPGPDVEHEPLGTFLKRRCRVVGIFPTETALPRLAGAVLLDTHEEWLAAERRYFSEGSMAKLYPERDDAEAITGGAQTGSARLIVTGDHEFQFPPSGGTHTEPAFSAWERVRGAHAQVADLHRRS